MAVNVKFNFSNFGWLLLKPPKWAGVVSNSEFWDSYLP